MEKKDRKPYAWYLDHWHWLNIILLIINATCAIYGTLHPNPQLWGRISNLLNAICVGYLIHDSLYRPMLREGNELLERTLDGWRRTLDNGRRTLDDDMGAAKTKGYFDDVV